MRETNKRAFRRALTLGLLLVLAAVLVWGLRPGRLTAQDAAEATVTRPVYLPAIFTRPAPPTAVQVERVNTTSFDTCALTDIAHAGDQRIFVVQRNGVIRIVEPNGAVRPTPFLDISRLVPDACEPGTRPERWGLGLLALAFHPNFPATPYFFVTYTALTDNALVLARYQVGSDPNTADAESGAILLRVPRPFDPLTGGPSPANPGGDLAFGRDGYLFVSLGDGGPTPIVGVSPTPGDPNNHAQSTNVLLGKLLRLDVDLRSPLMPDCGSAHYRVPADNPFVSDTAACGEVWSLGWRNPWRMTVDARTGDRWTADVGEWAREEVNLERAGAPGGRNYGWRCYEGWVDYSNLPHVRGGCRPVNLAMPVYSYTRSDGCAVIGGAVHRSAQALGLWGQYLFTDLCRPDQIGRIAEDNPYGSAARMPILNRTGQVWSVIAQGADGRVYLGEFVYPPGNSVNLYRLVVP